MLVMPLELLLPVESLVPVDMTQFSQIRNNLNRNSLNPNPRRRLGVLLARLARTAPATVMTTMMKTPTAP